MLIFWEKLGIISINLAILGANRVKKEIKVGIIVAIVEAILALAVGYVLYLVQEETIETKTVETIAGYFEEVDENMSYDEVLQFLYESSKEKDELIASLSQENEELSKLKEQVSSEEANKEIVSSAQTYATSNDYEMAIAILNSVINKTPKMEAMLTDYAGQYEAQTIAQVDAYISEEKYDEATEYIKHALEILPNSSILEQKKISVINSRPQNLMSALQPYETNGYTEKNSGEFMEMGGTRYSGGFQLGTSLETSYAIFNLNGQYTKISGIIGHVDGSGDSDKVVTISLDGVLKEAIDIAYIDLPRDFSINVTGVKQLIIERSSGSTQTGFAELLIR
jgi:tetratricopeptide (TPR) repeat protein